jgi:hypothetical protein
VVVGNLNTPGTAWAVAVVGNLVYVADGTAGLQVVNVTIPNSPVLVGGVDTPDLAIDVKVVGSYAYVANRFSGLYVVDVTNPASPAIVGHVDTPGEASNVAVAGEFAYVADRFNGLQVVDISQPASPVIIGGMIPTSAVYGVAVAEDLVYIAGGPLLIASSQCPSTTAVDESTVPESGGWLAQSRPNPFAPQSGPSEILFELGAEMHAKVRIFDATGRLVRVLVDESLARGSHVVAWDGRDGGGGEAGSGIYFYRLDAGPISETRALVMLR